jgi:hypothetical protein
MKQSSKAKLLATLMVLGVGTKGAAIEREGEIIFFELDGARYDFYLDTNQDGLPDCRMGLVGSSHGPAARILSRYLTQPGVKIIFEDEGLRPFENFGAGRMIGFIMPNGQFVRLDQMIEPAQIQANFPMLWAKIQAEQRGGR